MENLGNAEIELKCYSMTEHHLLIRKSCVHAIKEIHFDRISGHFRSIRNFIFLQMFYKMAAVGHFGCPKFTFDRISGQSQQCRN